MGWGVVEQQGYDYRACCYGCLETSSKTSTHLRLLALYEGIRECITTCSPHFVSIEKLFFGQNTTTAERVWEARGVALLAAAQFNLPVIEPRPSEAKMMVTGNNYATKDQMQGMVKLLLGLKEIPKPDDAADALAIAMTGLALMKQNTY